MTQKKKEVTVNWDDCVRADCSMESLSKLKPAIDPAGVVTAGNSSPAGVITVTVSTATMRPEVLDYDYDGERVQVGILGIAPLAGHVRLFDKNAYAGYEFIDFR